jgi:hypothetical protein
MLSELIVTGMKKDVQHMKNNVYPLENKATSNTIRNHYIRLAHTGINNTVTHTHLTGISMIISTRADRKLANRLPFPVPPSSVPGCPTLNCFTRS